MNATVSRAREAFEKGDLSEAKRLASANPMDLDAQLLLGVIAVRERRWQDGLPLLAEVTERQSESAVAPYWLSMLYRRIGKPKEATVMAELAVARAPTEAQNHNQVGLCHLDAERWMDAEANFQEAVRLGPAIPDAYENLGRALQGQGRTADALSAFRQCLTIEPRQISALCHLGQAALLELDYSTAYDCASSVLKIDRNSVSGHLLMAKASIGNHHPNEALNHVRSALKTAGDQPEVLTQCAVLHQSLGDLEESERLLVRSVEIEPYQGFAYFAIVRHRRGRVDVDLVAQMEKALGDSALPNRHRADLHYALGMVREAREDYESAMAHFNDANRLVRRQKYGDQKFDFAAYAAETERTIRAPSTEQAALDSDLPIFVVGMMRSGTTLVEQILSCHPEIGAAGEQRFDLASSGEEYLERLRRLGPGFSRVVDKLPDNCSRLGRLHATFPNARIIHVRRDPVDTCLSIWSTPNSARIEWANEKASIVFAYAQYLRLMEHWRAVIPEERMIEVRYEDLVTNQEHETRRLIDFLGLPWNDACLRPEDNDHPVTTPSVLQVRRPVTASSVGRWRRFGPWLGEFANLRHD